PGQQAGRTSPGAPESRSGRSSKGCSTGSRCCSLTAEQVADAGVPSDSAEAVAQLAEAVGAQGQEPLSDPLTLLRFYNARGKDVKEAAAMYQQAIEWRRSYSIREVMAEHGLGEDYQEDGVRATTTASWRWQSEPRSPGAKLAYLYGFFGRLDAPSEGGAPVLVWRAGAADYAGLVREGLVPALTRAFVAHLEDALQSSRAASLREGQLLRARLIVDSSGLGIGCVRFLPILREILTLGKFYFPEVTASVTVVRAPWVAAKLYAALRPRLTPLMQEKIFILGEDFQEGLERHSGLSLAALPTFLGGSADDTAVGKALPVPVGAGRLLTGGE
ncbi:unnamed protein product, partial [Polarella glacialis]